MHGRYSILRKIAEGGMAEIFLAELEGRQGFRKRVVLKCIRTLLYADPAFRQMLVDEALISTRLTHSNIVQVLDLGEAQGRYFLALELVDGWSLDQLFRRSRAAGHALPVELTLFMVAETCRALAFAHGLTHEGKALGVVHRDISPHNILISEHGDVKLADFGIAKALAGDDSSKTAAGVVKGKLAFMSPEQARAATIDARSDLFSLGTVLYLLTTGNLPFQAPTAIETLARVQAAEFPPPEKARAGLPKDVLRILHKAMKMRPEDRYQTADEMMHDLERVMRQLRPVGQTELRRWLAELSAKDGQLPISRQETTAPEKERPLGGSIELSSASNVVPTSLPKTVPSRTTGSAAKVAGGPGAPSGAGEAGGGGTIEPTVRSKTQKKKRSAHWLALPLATLMLGGGFALYREVSMRKPSWKDLPALKPETKDALAAPAPGAADLFTADAASVTAAPSEMVGAGEPALAGPDAGLAIPTASATATAFGVGSGESPLVQTPAPDAGAPPSVVEGTFPPMLTVGSADAGVASAPAGDAITDTAEEQRLLASAPDHPESIVIAEEESVPPPASPAPGPDGQEAAAAPPTDAPEKSDGPREPVRGAKSENRDASPETVSVYVQSQPPGAVVQLRNRVFGKTPIPLRFRPGMSFELTFLKAGYQRASKKFYVHERTGQKVTAYLKKDAAKRDSEAK